VTTLLEAVLQQAVPAGLSAEVADRLARQRCEQTPLLSAVAWAMRQVCGVCAVRCALGCLLNNVPNAPPPPPDP
jgi:hypothetical protein